MAGRVFFGNRSFGSFRSFASLVVLVDARAFGLGFGLDGPVRGLDERAGDQGEKPVPPVRHRAQNRGEHSDGLAGLAARGAKVLGRARARRVPGRLERRVVEEHRVDDDADPRVGEVRVEADAARAGVGVREGRGVVAFATHRTDVRGVVSRQRGFANVPDVAPVAHSARLADARADAASARRVARAGHDPPTCRGLDASKADAREGDRGHARNASCVNRLRERV